MIDPVTEDSSVAFGYRGTMRRFVARPLLLAGVLLASACNQGPEAPPPAAPTVPIAVGQRCPSSVSSVPSR